MVVKAEYSDMVQADLADTSSERVYEKYGWMILCVRAILGIFAALMTTLPPISWFWDPLFESAYSIMGALGIALVGFPISSRGR